MNITQALDNVGTKATNNLVRTCDGHRQLTLVAGKVASELLIWIGIDKAERGEWDANLYGTGADRWKFADITGQNNGGN